MDVREKTKEALCALGFSEVPSEWIDSLWDGNFCSEAVSLPYQAVEASVLLNEEEWARLVEACSHWPQAGNESGDGAGFWTTLMEAGVSYKCIMALVYCLMERTKQHAVDKTCALHAARLYVILLQLPGSGGYKLYHPMLFQKALNVVYLCPDDGQLTSKQARRRGPKGRRGKRKRKPETDDEDEAMEYECNGEVEVAGGSGEKVLKLIKRFIVSLQDCLGHHSLAECDVARYQLVQALLHLTRKELTGDTPLTLGPPRPVDRDCPIGQDTPMFVLAWTCLGVLCQRLHGPVEKITTEVFRQLLPSLLMLSEDGGVVATTPLPSSLTLCSKHTLAFVHNVISSWNEQARVPLMKLIQHICTKIPDRAEYRNKMALVVSQLLSLLPDDHYADMLDWLYKFSRNTKIGYRVFALDLFNKLLTMPIRVPQQTASLSEESTYRLTYKFLVRMVLSRCSDKAPSVRTRALVCLATAAASDSEELMEAVRRNIFQPLSANTHQGSENLIIEMVHRRTTDEKVGVRKAGLQALEAIVRMDKTTTRNQDIAVIHERCLDPALSVRKQAISSLTTILLERRDNAKLQSYWLDGVLPMVMDREVGGEEKCLQLLQEVLLDNLAPLHRSTGASHCLAWQLFSLVAEENRLDLQRHLRRAMGAWSRAGYLTPALLKDICSHTEKEDHVKAAWMLLAEVSQFSKSIESKFLFDNWNRHKDTGTGNPLVQILIVIGNLAASVSRIAVEDIKDDIIVLLSGFKLTPPVIQAAVNTLCLISSALNAKPNYQASLDSWCVPLLKACEDYLTVFLKGDSHDVSGRQEVEIQTYLFTLGEIAQLCPSHTSHHLCLMVQSILLASSEAPATPMPTPPPPDREGSTPPCSQGTTLPSSQGSSLSFLSSLKGQALPPRLRAHAYITLGKLCLQNEDLAKRSVVQMARELLTSQHPAIRNNIIIILCDLAIRYSTKVDPYITTISSCLKDQSLLVRKQTLTLLARLLQEDYIKWKGPLFFHFTSCLVDSDLNRFGEFCMTHLLKVRHPAMFYQHFVESIFFFNSYEKHKVYNHFKLTDREKALFSLKGKKNTAKRHTIYTFLLSNMTDEQRFQLTAKLCQEVIGGLVDGVIPLDDDGVGVVKDTLAILASKEIKLTSLRRNVGEELSEEGDQVGAAVAKAQTKIITQLVKRNVMENVVPTVIAAKHLFEKEHDPLLRDLLLYLKEIMQDYRNEVGEILAGDPQLAKEIQFDLKRFDEEQRRVVQTPPTTATPHALMVSPLLSPGALGPVATATVMATPPKLKTPAGSPRQNVTKTPFRLPLNLSPLVVINATPVGNRQNMLTPTSRGVNGTPTSRAARGMPVQAPDRVKEFEDTGNGDVASPEAARARAVAVSQDYMEMRTPVAVLPRGRKASIPLQRAVLLASARKAGVRPKQLPTPGLVADETALHGRLASTPEGLAESISFSVSSLLPPSPIPINSTLRRPPALDPARRGAGKPPRPGPPFVETSGEGKGGDDGAGRAKRRSKRIRVREIEADLKSADICMPLPNTESKPLTKWKVQVK